MSMWAHPCRAAITGSRSVLNEFLGLWASFQSLSVSQRCFVLQTRLSRQN